MLEDSGSYGLVKMEAKKSYLVSLGASGSLVTKLAGYTYVGSSTSGGYPGADGGTKRDRYPSGTEKPYMLQLGKCELFALAKSINWKLLVQRRGISKFAPVKQEPCEFTRR